MSELISMQGHLFLVTIISGIAIGILYDTLRILRRVVVHKNWMINLEDGLFWIVSSLFLFIILFKQNNGAIRGYAIMGVVIGMLLYFSLVSYFFVKITSSMIKRVLHFIGQSLVILLTPLKIMIKIILRPLKFLKKKGRQNGKRLKKWLKTVKLWIKKI